MNITVASFYADIPGKPSRLSEYLPLIQASRRALELTNPGARFVVLTDSLTAPQIEPHAEVWIGKVSPDLPLMQKLIRSQALFAAGCDADLLLLPDVDCFANRDLTGAIPQDVGLAITHKGPKFKYRVNNMAYARDTDLAAWFLARASAILDSWAPEAHQWWGDQEAWAAALGVQINGLGAAFSYVVVERIAGEILVAHPADKTVHIYPCDTHNCFLADDGAMRPKHHEAYFVHLKGPRKEHVERFMAERFGL